VSWWCSSSKQTWTWTYRPYLGALAIVFGLVAVAIWWARRGRLSSASFDVPPGVELTVIEGTSRGRTIAFVLGVVGLWACIDWPLAALGAGYLALAQMTRQIFMVMVVAPLLLFACHRGPVAAHTTTGSCLLDDTDDVVPATGAQQGIDPRQPTRQRLSVSLHQTAGGNQRLIRSLAPHEGSQLAQ